MLFLLQNLSSFYLVYYLFGLFSGELSRENNSLFALSPSYPLGIKRLQKIHLSYIYLNTHGFFFWIALLCFSFFLVSRRFTETRKEQFLFVKSMVVCYPKNAKNTRPKIVFPGSFKTHDMIFTSKVLSPITKHKTLSNLSVKGEINNCFKAKFGIKHCCANSVEACLSHCAHACLTDVQGLLLVSFYSRFQFPNFIINVQLYLGVNMLKYKFLRS